LATGVQAINIRKAH